MKRMGVIVSSVLSSFKSQQDINGVKVASCSFFVQQKTGVQNRAQSHLGFVVSYVKGQVRRNKKLKAFGSEKIPFFMK